jgi:hypothetical protein
MGRIIEFVSEIDGQPYRASIVPVKKRFRIPGPRGMRGLGFDFDSFVEIAVYRKSDSPLGFFRIFSTPDYLIEINEMLYRLTPEEWPVFCDEILTAENILHGDRQSEKMAALQKKWAVMRVTHSQLSLPFLKKVPMALYVRQKE